MSAPYGDQPQQPAYRPGPPTTEVPGRTLGIVGLVLFFFTAIVGLVVVALGTVAQKCQQLGPGVHRDGGVTYTCG